MLSSLTSCQNGSLLPDWLEGAEILKVGVVWELPRTELGRLDVAGNFPELRSTGWDLPRAGVCRQGVAWRVWQS